MLSLSLVSVMLVEGVFRSFSAEMDMLGLHSTVTFSNEIARLPLIHANP